MKIVKCVGGLGNQMFQYAFYRVLESIFKDVRFDVSPFNRYKIHNGFELSRIFGIKFKSPTLRERLSLSFQSGGILFSILRRFCGRRQSEYRESGLNYDEYAVSNSSDLYYIGYWQSWRYFDRIENEIRASFSFCEGDLPSNNIPLLEKIRKSNSVSIHIRRGDYLGNAVYENITTPSYYENAIAYIMRNVEHPHFFIFTNDPIWCNANIKLQNSILVNLNRGADSYWDMFLMSQCKHNIIANSSFSWWGAWLNNHAFKIVIAPNKWINLDNVELDDIIPQTWIKI